LKEIMAHRFFQRIILFFKRVIISALVIVLLLPFLYIFLLNWINPPLTPLMVQRVLQGYSMKQTWIALDQIPMSFKKAVIVAEDSQFCSHNGFDSNALKIAIKRYLKGQKGAGGSTISMQTTKNLLLLPQRSVVRKVLEIYYTIGLERLLKKQRIFEIYSNIIETAQGVYGVAEAVPYYYGVTVNTLTPRQASRLVTVLPGPLYRMPNGQLQKSNQIYRRMMNINDRFLTCLYEP
jgi:monofunctional glycosyltransferase